MTARRAVVHLPQRRHERQRARRHKGARDADDAVGRRLMIAYYGWSSGASSGPAATLNGEVQFVSSKVLVDERV